MSAYQLGYEAAINSSYPVCPFDEESQERYEWYEGFGDGLDDFISAKDLD